MARRRRSRGAYTLLEITLVMAIMVILGALSFPSIDAMYDGVKMDGATDSIRAAWSEAQAHAINESRPYRFAVVPGKGNYRVAPADDSTFWSGGTPSRGPDDQWVVREGSLPKGIVFPNPDGSTPPVGNEDTALPDGSVGPGQWVPTAVFLPTGTAEDDVDIPLRLEGVRSAIIHLRALTGVITVERGD
jgi:type II secretory pathway pseudopilin PulG